MQGSLCSLDPPSSGHHLSSPEPIIYNVRISPSLHLLYKKQRRRITLSANVIVQASPFKFFPLVKLHFCQFLAGLKLHRCFTILTICIGQASPLFHHFGQRWSFTFVSFRQVWSFTAVSPYQLAICIVQASSFTSQNQSSSIITYTRQLSYSRMH